MAHTRTASKVPEITLYFWIIKILTTGMGETTSDYLIHKVGLSNTLGLVVLVFVTGLALLGCLLVQITAAAYQAPLYWLAVVMVGIFGTMSADGVHVQLGVPYIASTAFFGLALAVVFFWWNRSEGTLSIHSIRTRRRELFYWAAVLVTFALGTAAGDMTAFSLNLGFFVSGLLFLALFAIPAIGYRWFGLNGVLAFWLAYIVTRPLGASFADLFAAPHSLGGLGIGYGTVSALLGVVIFALVAYLTVTAKDVQPVGEAELTS
ncbi:MAG TPA: hypothetical protein VHW68_07915 [Actinomycetota bacterium]|nr:hypothetical protein [Actinomycetota bacterium]